MRTLQVFRKILLLLAIWLVSNNCVDAQWYFFKPYFYSAQNWQQPLDASGNAYTATAPIANTPFICEVGYHRNTGGPRPLVSYTPEGWSSGSSDSLGLWSTVIPKFGGGNWTVGGGSTIPPASGMTTNVLYLWDAVSIWSVIFYFQ